MQQLPGRDAVQLHASIQFFWNILVWQIKAVGILDEVGKMAPACAQHCSIALKAHGRSASL